MSQSLLPLAILFALMTNAAAGSDPRVGPDAYSFARSDMPASRQADFNHGRGLFRQPWIVAPALDSEVDGLGPLHNRLSCVACHPRNGRGAPSEAAGEPLRSTLVRLSIPGPNSRPQPDPVYGDQLNTEAIPGVPPEGQATLVWHEEPPQVLADGTAVPLRRPQLVISGLNYGPLSPGIMTSVRMAPPVFGLGLLESIPDAVMEAEAARQQRETPATAGRINRIESPDGRPSRLGRFGLKANQPSILAQVAGAFIGDLGLTSAQFPQENCTPSQTACAAQPNGGSPELSESQLQAVTAYMAWLAPPPRRDADTDPVKAGEMAFAAAGCAACHVTDLAGVAAYSDLLLHDMGDDLADGRPDHLAGGREWRTTPLWGIGLAGVVGEDPRYLHDGRARTIPEAILWHGGQGDAAREAFKRLPAAGRTALLSFLQSL